MSQKVHMKHADLDNIKNNMKAYSEEQSEGFHNNFMNFERCCQKPLEGRYDRRLFLGLLREYA